MRVAGLFLALVLLAMPLTGCAASQTGVSAGTAADVDNKSIPWPPMVGKAYPDVKLINTEGKTVSLRDFKGQVLIVEPIGMSCPACQAWAGAHKRGGLDGVQPQGGLESAEESMPQYAKGIQLQDRRIVYVQMILYNMGMGAPTAADLKKWQAHFMPNKPDNWHVLGGTPDMINTASYNMIPGFQLVDKNFVLRYDSAGHNPPHGFYTDLMPALPGILEE